jgi:SAM-dependent methyltransferase
MDRGISGNVWNILACPDCGGALRNAGEYASCAGCETRYAYAKSGALDLRLQRPKKSLCEFILGTALLPPSGVNFDVLPENDNPEVRYDDSPVPFRLSKELLSHFPRAKTDRSLALDLGCGDTIHRQACEHAGFEYVGLDYESQEAALLGDAHSLPFQAESFEFILSIAVLEHIRFPFVMMKEAYRVLKPKGVLIGTVAFLEPFHGDSFYHHTHLGTYNCLQAGGFEVERICPSNRWTVLTAQAAMGLFPRMPRLLAKSFVMPVHLCHRIWWRMGGLFCPDACERTRTRNMTGSFTFIARRA